MNDGDTLLTTAEVATAFAESAPAHLVDAGLRASDAPRHGGRGRFQIDAERCVYVGDDYEADDVRARSVDIRALLVDPLGRAPIACRDRIESILDLEPVLDRCSIGADETDVGRGDNH